MKISESTLEVLQNFSSINNGITVQTVVQHCLTVLQVSSQCMTFQSFLQQYHY